MAQAPTAATYTNDPANVPIDRVRLEIGDTDCASAYLTDAEVELYIDLEDPLGSGLTGPLLRAASNCAGVIAAKVAKRINFQHGPVKKDVGSLFDHYNELARTLANRANVEGAIPDALGVTVAEKQAADADESRIQPGFKKGMMDNPRSGPFVPTDPSESSTL